MNTEYQNTESQINSYGTSGRKLLHLAAIFADSIKAVIHFLIWLVIGSASLAAAYLGIRVILVAVKIISKALGI